MTKKLPGRTGIKKRHNGELYYRWRNSEGALGGYVHESVITPTPENVYIAENVFVHGGTIRGGTIRGGTIRGGTIRGGTIRGGTIEGGTIRGGTIRGGTIWGGTIYGGTIDGGTIRKNILYIAGSRHGVTFPAKPGHVGIGCEVHTVEQWMKNYKRIGKNQGYSVEQIKEYGEHIKYISKVKKHFDSEE